MFPGPTARIYRNEAGEVLGWDYPSDDPDGYPEREELLDRAWEIAKDQVYQEFERENAEHGVDRPFDEGDHEERIDRLARDVLVEWGVK